jgi:carboxymethylenebutenolidase
MTDSTADTARSLDHFESGGKSIRVETFGGRESHAPSVIVLHGATGVEFANRFIAVIGHNLAATGFVVHLVHYFDRTGTRYADDDTIRRASADWLNVVSDATAFVHRSRPSAGIGLFGFSLGGYLAAAESVRNPRIACCVVLSGGIDAASVRTMKHAPPTLILHGGADTRVPLREARRLEAALSEAGNSPAFHVYPGEGHIMQFATYADVLERAASWFRQHLHGTPAA